MINEISPKTPSNVSLMMHEGDYSMRTTRNISAALAIGRAAKYEHVGGWEQNLAHLVPGLASLGLVENIR